MSFDVDRVSEEMETECQTDVSGSATEGREQTQTCQKAG